jgi:release factor glutamine methyltransferase
MSVAVAELIGASALPAREARALLAHRLRLPREQLIAHPEQLVSDCDAAVFRALAARRVAGEPLAYLLGTQEFYGRAFDVSPAVLVPRPETERLVELALERICGIAAPRVLDLGTGSGCIAVTLALERPDANVVATDVAESALAIAHGNANRLGARVEFHCGAWYEALPPGSAPFDLIAANPPYVARGDPHLEGLRFEPRHALTDGSDGLASLRAVVRGAADHAAARGWLIVEHGYDQQDAVCALFVQHGWRAHAFLDLAGQPRVTLGQRA